MQLFGSTLAPLHFEFSRMLTDSSSTIKKNFGSAAARRRTLYHYLSERLLNVPRIARVVRFAQEVDPLDRAAKEALSKASNPIDLDFSSEVVAISFHPIYPDIFVVSHKNMSIFVMCKTDMIWKIDMGAPQYKDPFCWIRWHSSGSYFACLSGRNGLAIVSLPIKPSGSNPASVTHPKEKFEFARPEILPVQIQGVLTSACVLDLKETGKNPPIVAALQETCLSFHGERSYQIVNFGDNVEKIGIACCPYSVKDVPHELVLLITLVGDISCYDPKSCRTYPLGGVRDVLDSQASDVLVCYEVQVTSTKEEFLVLVSVGSKYMILKLSCTFAVEGGNAPSLRSVGLIQLDSFGDVQPTMSLGKKLLLVCFEDRFEIYNLRTLERQLVLPTASEYDLISDGVQPRKNATERIAVIASISPDDSCIMHCTRDKKVVRKVAVSETLDRERQFQDKPTQSN
eukprot:TRINITY_DN7670_c0_g1_i2.p1 TRINITY_DN7670_c0_g1~~TRINITY_DN7670_c0_g1_i2.p1  ORF type:complete len:456 (-),score=104.21 TRINITY_DN7670_c0_g1_i2:35-1402(-)